MDETLTQKEREAVQADRRVVKERVETKVSYSDLPDTPLLDRGIQTLSVIIPAKNEEPNLPLLIERLFSALRAIGRPFEAIVVNDGSTDGSLRALRELVACHRELRVIDLARNYGQTSAMMAGFAHARGDIIVPMDADLQNDPADCAGPRSTSLSGKACVSSMRAAESARTHFLRRFIVIDVVTLAMLDTPRIMAGALVFHLVLTFWMLAFCTFIFLSLALAKRYTELWRARSRRDGAHAHGRGYDLQDMAMIASFGTASGYI